MLRTRINPIYYTKLLDTLQALKQLSIHDFLLSGSVRNKPMHIIKNLPNKFNFICHKLGEKALNQPICGYIRSMFFQVWFPFLKFMHNVFLRRIKTEQILTQVMKRS